MIAPCSRGQPHRAELAVEACHRVAAEAIGRIAHRGEGLLIGVGDIQTAARDELVVEGQPAIELAVRQARIEDPRRGVARHPLGHAFVDECGDVRARQLAGRDVEQLVRHDALPAGL